jgi:hypothetical protein
MKPLARILVALTAVTIGAVLPRVGVAQAPTAVAAASTGDTRVATTPAVMKATATRATRPPAIDGRDNDDVWRDAPAITQFRQFDPVEDGEARFRTSAKVAYDDRNFYVFVRMFDPHPDSILRLLARRDVRTASDQIKIIIDSYHDRRTGYEFALNPAGVRRDFIIYNDSDEDESWDGVWDGATTIDSLGWTAEFRIPLSQLRYSNSPSHTFGFAVWRDIERYKERVSWPLYRNRQNGLASQLGEIEGIAGISSPRRLEISPYTVTKNVTVPDGNDFNREQRLSAGADLKYGLSSNLTLDATVNPDFGQVESDPAVLNLGAFETFFQERRPFFMEGTGMFRFNVNCSVVNCGAEGLFYSRRIGRQPQMSNDYGDEHSPTSTTILGASKLTGRLRNGLNVGLLEAVTQRELGSERRTIEPQTNYVVARGQQDLRKGETGIGLLVTAVDRQLDGWTDKSLRRHAYTSGLDFRHRFLNRRFELTGSLATSYVSGTADAIAATQRSSVHYFQRPDSKLNYDPTRTTLVGDAQEILFGKTGGGLLRFQTSYLRRSPGFEANDLGFLQRADEQSFNNWAQLGWQKPSLFYKRFFWNFNEWQSWTSKGLLLGRFVNTNAHTELKNSMWLHLGGTYSLGGSTCDRCSRGGPAVARSQNWNMWGGVEGDQRKSVSPGLWMSAGRSDEGRSHYLDFSPNMNLRVSTGLTGNVGISFNENLDDWQWLDNPTVAGVTHYTFARLRQRTVSMSTRVNYTATPNLTLQVYAEPFVSRGQYADLRELNSPRSKDYESRFKPYVPPSGNTDPGGFNFKQFRSNAVMRWEYRPGSSLYLVWSQGRNDYDNVYGDSTFREDYRKLFKLHPDNTFLVKMSYWFSR